MESEFDLDEILKKSIYFQKHLGNLLAILQPSYYCLDLIVRVLLHGPDGSGKRLLAKAAAKNLNMKLCEERVADLFDENVVGTEKKVKSAIAKLANSAPCIAYWTGYELFCYLDKADLERIEQCINDSLDELLSENNAQPIVFISATREYDKVYCSPLSSLFQHSVQVKPLTLDEAKDLLQVYKQELNLRFDETKMDLIYSDHNYYIGNLMDLMSKSEVDNYKFEILRLSREKEQQSNQEGTSWLDIGGLNHVKQEIIDTIQLALDFPQLKKSGLRRTGVLLFGPPGTGKTLLAKAVATECNLNFIDVKGPELLNEYVGQSEDNLRKLFQRARDSSPSVIFFDEIDSLAPNRGQTGDSGGVMDRMVSQLLSEMDGIGKGDDVFVIGATNRLDLVDSSLLRPGRFDKILEVPIPNNKQDRLAILKALTRKMRLSDEVDLDKVESLARTGMSGADFQGLCSRAMHRTFNRCVDSVESGLVSEDDVEAITTMDDFVQSLID